MLQGLINDAASVETIESFFTEDSCSTVSTEECESPLKVHRTTEVHQDRSQSHFVLSHALRTYYVELDRTISNQKATTTAHTERLTSCVDSSIRLTLVWKLVPQQKSSQRTRAESLDAFSESHSHDILQGRAQVIFPLSKEELCKRNRRLALALVINRDFILKCTSCLSKQHIPCDKSEQSSSRATDFCHWFEETGGACLPREGTQLTLYFGQPENVRDSSSDGAFPTTAGQHDCRSFDVVNLKPDGKALLHGIPLKPFHRYHLKYTSDRGIELNLNRYCFFHLYVDSDNCLSKHVSCSLSPVQLSPFKRPGKCAKPSRKTHARQESHVVCLATRCTASTKKSTILQRRSIRTEGKPQQTNRTSADHSSTDSFPSFSLGSGKSNRSTNDISAVALPRPLLSKQKQVLFTTGMRLNREEERQCARLGFVVNPSLSRAQEASVLVVQGPLMRSVKLLTVLPYVKALVHRKWLDDILTQSNTSLPIEGYVYSESKCDVALESVNEFSIERTLSIPSIQRQVLFKSHTFWVHPSTVPQEPPMNDLHSVLIASGGKTTEKIAEANTWVLPSHNPSTTCLKVITRALKREEAGKREHPITHTSVFNHEELLLRAPSSDVCVVAPEDIFRSVLQQSDLNRFALRLSSKVWDTIAKNASEKKSTTLRRTTKKERNEEKTVYLALTSLLVGRILMHLVRKRFECNFLTTRSICLNKSRTFTNRNKSGHICFIIDTLAPHLQNEFDAEANHQTLKHLIHRAQSASAKGTKSTTLLKEARRSVVSDEQEENLSVSGIDPVISIRVLNDWVHLVSWKCTSCATQWVARPVDRANPQTRESTSCPRCRAAHSAQKFTSVIQGRCLEMFRRTEASASAHAVKGKGGLSSEALKAPKNGLGNSLLVEQYPLVASQWDFDRNCFHPNHVSQRLEEVRTSSSIMAWWKCSLCARPWCQSVISRVVHYEDLLKKTYGNARSMLILLCPSCEQRGSGKRFRDTCLQKSSNLPIKCESLGTNVPPKRFLSENLFLMEEACLRPDQDPSTIPLRSEQVLSWRCRYCAYKFQARLKSRVESYDRCPQCSGKVCTPMNSLVIQRPGIIREVAKTISRRKLKELTVSSEEEIPFVCRTCYSPYWMSVKVRCMLPENVIACQKCFLNFSQVVQTAVKDGKSLCSLSAKERIKLKHKAQLACLSSRSKEKLEVTRNDLRKKDRILIN